MSKNNKSYLLFNSKSYAKLKWKPATYYYKPITGWFVSEYGHLYNNETNEIRIGHDNVKGKDKHKRISIKHKLYYVSRIVAEAFVENSNRDENIIVRHINDDPDNNHYSNLIWGTSRENTFDAIRNHKIVYDSNRKYTIGEKHPNALLCDSDIKEIIELLNNSIPIKVIAKKYNVKVGVINHIYTGKSWKHLTQKYLPFPERQRYRIPMDKNIQESIKRYLAKNPNAKATEITTNLSLPMTNTIKTYIGKVKRKMKNNSSTTIERQSIVD